MSKKFSKELSEYGLTIISGMAEGIDEYAHQSCLESGGKTIAILPSGFKNIFPEKNKTLYKKILDNQGLILTEYEENVKAESRNFLDRNRIISALSIGILVIEGGYRSGTSVTAKIAKRQGKKIFCIPSSLENSKGLVPNKLIKEGNILVTNVQDIIQNYKELNLKKVKIKSQKLIDDEYKEIYSILKEEMHINQICKITNSSIQEVNAKLIMLELEDKVISLPGNYYKRKEV